MYFSIYEKTNLPNKIIKRNSVWFASFIRLFSIYFYFIPCIELISSIQIGIASEAYSIQYPLNASLT